MKTIYHAANSRGLANHGWLKSNHTFSFGGYHNPERIHFGTLRVINDDHVEGGMGFGKHPHQDMEIISIPLEGQLKHSDDMGNSGTITKGEIQVMSAGTGIYHSEQNGEKHQPVQFLQIWVFPRANGLAPRYDQQRYDNRIQNNEWTQILSPNADDDGVWIYQDAWFNWGRLDKGTLKNYKIHKEGNGVYVFVIKGEVAIAGQKLNNRDGLGISDTNQFEILATENTEILLMEIPMIS